jgi:hypothetical protein
MVVFVAAGGAEIMSQKSWKAHLLSWHDVAFIYKEKRWTQHPTNYSHQKNQSNSLSTQCLELPSNSWLNQQLFFCILPSDLASRDFLLTPAGSQMKPSGYPPLLGYAKVRSFQGFASMKQQTLFTLDERNALEEERHRGSESRDAYKAMATSPFFYCNPSPTRRLTSKGDLYLPAEQAALQLELMTSGCTSRQYL